MTHDDLVSRAASWLKKRHPVVITEMVTGIETPDAIGWLVSGMFSTLIECKVSRADFRGDAKKLVRKNGGLGSRRFYMTPPGLLRPEEIPYGWGLLEAHKKCVKRIVHVDYRETFDNRVLSSELSLLISCLRRIGPKDLEGVSVRAYTHETKNTAMVSIHSETEDCAEGGGGVMPKYKDGSQFVTCEACGNAHNLNYGQFCPVCKTPHVSTELEQLRARIAELESQVHELRQQLAWFQDPDNRDQEAGEEVNE